MQRLVNTDYKDLAPRVGLAYSPSDKTVIRAGYGIGFVDPDRRGGHAQQQRIQRPVLLPRQHHGVSVHRAHLHAQQRPARPGDALADRAHRQPALHRPHGSQSVLADLELQRTAGAQSVVDVRSRLRRHQRQPAADGIQHQCRAARHAPTPLRGSRSDRRSARSASSRTAPIPSITGFNRKSKSAFRAACISWVPTPGRSRSTIRATARTIPRPAANIRRTRSIQAWIADSPASTGPTGFVGSVGVGNPVRARPSRAFPRARTGEWRSRRMAIERDLHGAKAERRSAC